MGRTVQDIAVQGRNIQDVRNEIMSWMNSVGAWIVDDRQTYIKIQDGVGIWEGIRYFEISLRQDQNGVVVHTEGYVKTLGSESDLSPGAISAALPRRKGFRAIQDLWNRLGHMSARGPQAQTPAPSQPTPAQAPPQQAPAPAPQQRPPPPPPPQPPQYPCQKCGKPLTFIQQYNRWYCYTCQTYA